MTGWEKLPPLDEMKRQTNLANFPPEQRWETVQGAGIQGALSKDGHLLVSIQGRDHTGAMTAIWTDLPNAMYLMNLLYNLQRQLGAVVPSDTPPACKPYDG
jgi:hypothetical protein